MQSVDLFGLEKLDIDLKVILDEVPELRRELHKSIASILQEGVDVEIANYDLNDSMGKARGWHELRVSSRGGNAAIKATDSNIGDDSLGANTYYLENDHVIRNPSGKSKRYNARIRTPYVDDFHFYSGARRNTVANAIEAAEKYVKEIVERLEG